MGLYFFKDVVCTRTRGGILTETVVRVFQQTNETSLRVLGPDGKRSQSRYFSHLCTFGSERFTAILHTIFHFQSHGLGVTQGSVVTTTTWWVVYHPGVVYTPLIDPSSSSREEKNILGDRFVQIKKGHVEIGLLWSLSLVTLRKTFLFGISRRIPTLT